MAYDIRDPKRLRRVHKIAKGFGWAMQYSVFICDVDAIELLDLKRAVGDVINSAEDAVAFIDIGEPSTVGRSAFTFLGVAVPLPTSGVLIV
jgi:CRISPR-associated protein Cas2